LDSLLDQKFFLFFEHVFFPTSAAEANYPVGRVGTGSEQRKPSFEVRREKEMANQGEEIF